MRYVVVAVLGVLIAFVSLLGLSLAMIVKRADEIERDILRARAEDREKAQQYTVRWTRHGNVECAYRGVIVPLDDWNIVVEGDDGPVLVRRADICEVMP